jgi:molecular chaperone GrpE
MKPQENEIPATPEDTQPDNLENLIAEAEVALSAPEGEEEKLRAELAEMKNQMLRALADADNTRKRAEREREDTAKYAISSFARDLVSVFENLARAVQAIPPEAREGNDLMATLAQGVDLTLNEMEAAFDKHGLKRVDPIGQKFDHAFHQAVSQIEMPGHEPGTVMQVIQCGYVLNDRLLRPALVVVSKAAASTAETTLDTKA